MNHLKYIFKLLMLLSFSFVNSYADPIKQKCRQRNGIYEEFNISDSKSKCFCPEKNRYFNPFKQKCEITKIILQPTVGAQEKDKFFELKNFSNIFSEQKVSIKNYINEMCLPRHLLVLTFRNKFTGQQYPVSINCTEGEEYSIFSPSSLKLYQQKKQQELKNCLNQKSIIENNNLGVFSKDILTTAQTHTKCESKPFTMNSCSNNFTFRGILGKSSQANCYETLYQVFKDNFTATGEFIVDIGQWLSKQAFNLLNSGEKNSSESSLLASNSSENLMKKLDDENEISIQETLSNFMNSIWDSVNGYIKEVVLCEEWKNPEKKLTAQGVCLRPGSYNCMNCEQIVNGMCGAIGFIGSEGLITLLTGGTIKAGSIAIKAGRKATPSLIKKAKYTNILNNEKIKQLIELAKNSKTYEKINKIKKVIGKKIDQTKRSKKEIFEDEIFTSTKNKKINIPTVPFILYENAKKYIFGYYNWLLKKGGDISSKVLFGFIAKHPKVGNYFLKKPNLLNNYVRFQKSQIRSIKSITKVINKNKDLRVKYKIMIKLRSMKSDEMMRKYLKTKKITSPEEINSYISKHKTLDNFAMTFGKEFPKETLKIERIIKKSKKRNNFCKKIKCHTPYESLTYYSTIEQKIPNFSFSKISNKQIEDILNPKYNIDPKSVPSKTLDNLNEIYAKSIPSPSLERSNKIKSGDDFKPYYQTRIKKLENDYDLFFHKIPEWAGPTYFSIRLNKNLETMNSKVQCRSCQWSLIRKDLYILESGTLVNE
jgi:hypothetical protein